MQIQNFYNGSSGSTRTLIVMALEGAFMSKYQDDAYNMLEEMSINNYQWLSERILPKKVAGLHEIKTITTLTTQVHTLT